MTDITYIKVSKIIFKKIIFTVRSRITNFLIYLLWNNKFLFAFIKLGKGKNPLKIYKSSAGSFPEFQFFLGQNRRLKVVSSEMDPVEIRLIR